MIIDQSIRIIILTTIAFFVALLVTPLWQKLRPEPRAQIASSDCRSISACRASARRSRAIRSRQSRS